MKKTNPKFYPANTELLEFTCCKCKGTAVVIHKLPNHLVKPVGWVKRDGNLICGWCNER